jgi:acyl carrier protein
MNIDHIRSVIQASLRSVAPESSPELLARGANLREELDLDSMDFLNFVTALHQELRVEIPERDYAKLATLEGAEHYLAERTA